MIEPLNTGSQNHWETTEDNPHRAHMLERYVLARKHVSGRVLDWACGFGVGSSMLADVAEQVWGMDINNYAVRVGREHISADNVKLQAGDIEEQAGQVRQWKPDWLVCTETLEHLVNPLAFLRRMQCCVTTGIVVSVPSWPTHNRFHIHDFTADQVDGWFRDYPMDRTWQRREHRTIEHHHKGRQVMEYYLAAWEAVQP